MRFLLISISLLLHLSAVTQERSEIEQEIEKVLFKNIEFEQHVRHGVIIATIAGDQINYFSYGAANPNKNTVFETGDISKGLTGTLLHILHQKGKISINTRVNDGLPRVLQNSVFDDLTIQDLLSHTSGLPRIPDNIGQYQVDANQPFGNYDSAAFKEFIQSLETLPTQREYSYSHVNFELLKLIIENKLGDTFDDILSMYLSTPLGLRNTTVETTGTLAPGHNQIGKSIPVQHLASFQAAKGIKSSAADLALLISQMMDQEHRFLSAFNASIKPVNPTLIDRSTSIASGWHAIEMKRYYDLIVHKGSTSGHSGIVAFVPETKTAVIVLSCTEKNIAPLGYQLIQYLNHNWKRRKLLK
ncbi:MAG: beta-lactamase family protein [Bacteroidia bacterium]|nr:beta-lactamase family protein [Bacteroidia bacterium]